MDIFLTLDMDKNVIKSSTKIKVSYSKLAIEQRRHTCTSVENRICPLCKLHIEDEYHFNMVCPKLKLIRDKLFSEIFSIIPSFDCLDSEA